MLSLQVSFGAISLLAAVALGVRLLRRGETSVGHHASASTVIPATTTAAPASRRRPAGSPSTSAA